MGSFARITLTAVACAAASAVGVPAHAVVPGTAWAETTLGVHGGGALPGYSTTQAFTADGTREPLIRGTQPDWQVL